MSTLFCSLLPHIIDKVFIRKILGMDYRFKMDFKLVYKRFSHIIYQQTADGFQVGLQKIFPTNKDINTQQNWFGKWICQSNGISALDKKYKKSNEQK